MGATLDIQPYTIAVPDAVLDDLQERLVRTRLPEPLPGAGWEYGTRNEYLRSVVDTWRDDYDWRERERELNELDHFLTDIDGTRVHFVHVRSPEPDATPLVLTHGWPGTFVEFLQVLGPLSDPRAHGGDPADAFHLVVPSLPGYAFSGPTHERGLHLGVIARKWARLMAALGYDRYLAQGGDWGSFVTSLLALADPDHCVGIHLNMIAPFPDGAPDTWTPEEQAFMDQFNQQYMLDGAGYMRIQSTRPHTVGYGLDDSPAGLAAWIIEKFREWSDCDGDPERSFTREALLDNVMLYWVNGTATSSARTYYEFDQAMRRGEIDLFSRISTPTGYARYPKEIMRTSRRWAEQRFEIVHFADMERGGHFAAFEVPEMFVPDVRAWARTVRDGGAGS
ncbi:MAG TPA: epoxide hydrolase [Acidimicrobiia bacterium]|nr:epoxide hydrolase [Acidimicrobiia bacterium]